MGWLTMPHGRIEIDERSGGLTHIQLGQAGAEFVIRPDPRGLLRVASPLPEFGAHYLETDLHGQPEVETRENGIVLRYPCLESTEGVFPIQVELDLKPTDDGLVLRAKVHNGWSTPIPQIVFPQMFGLGAVGGLDHTRMQLGRGRIFPFRELALRPDDPIYLDLGLYRYYGYGFSAFNMKWLDYGSSEAGFSLYARDARYNSQGLLIERPDRAAEHVSLRWIHYPFLQAGDTWESPEYVLLFHDGDWYEGARAYKKFADTHYPYRAPKRLRDALGIRSIWLTYPHSRPMYHFADLPDLASELEDLDLAELCIWGWHPQFGYPLRSDPRLGTVEEFSSALRQCQEMGAPICLFVSHHLLADGPETDSSWLHLNAAHQRESSNWTYSRDFLPRFGPLFSATHSAVRGSALSAGWRERGLAEYRRLVDLGAHSICFDQFFPWNEPNFNPERDGQPAEEGDRLLDFGRQARDLIQAANPEGTFSGEGVTDASVPILDYTWEWRNGYHLQESGPFRYVFPQFRLNANVNEHPRSALLAFVEGALLNVMPGGMEHRLRDCPTLVTTLRKLAVLRRRFLPYFADGQYRFEEGLSAAGVVARSYTLAGSVLVLLTNPTDSHVDASLSIDLSVYEMDPGILDSSIFNIDGRVAETVTSGDRTFRWASSLEADGFRAIEIRPRGNRRRTA